MAEDVNIPLIQIVKNKQETTFETGVDELENIIDDLNEKNGTFNYQISAILEDGAATSVVIYDKTNTYEKPNRPVDSDITVVLNKVVLWMFSTSARSPTLTISWWPLRTLLRRTDTL